MQSHDPKSNAYAVLLDCSGSFKSYREMWVVLALYRCALFAPHTALMNTARCVR